MHRAILVAALILTAPTLAAADGSDAPPEALGSGSYTEMHLVLVDPITDPAWLAVHPSAAVPVLHVVVFLPDGDAPVPTVVLRHGLGDQPDLYLNWGALLASHGHAVLIPWSRGLNYDSDADQHTADLLRLLDWAHTENAASVGTLAGRLDTGRLALAGYSFGGVSVAQAANALSDHPEWDLRAVALVDPAGGTSEVPGVTAVSQAWAPTMILRGDHYNELTAAHAALEVMTDVDQWIAALPADIPRAAVRINGALHFDIFDPYPPGYEPIGRPEQQDLFQRYTTAWLRHHLSCDAAVTPWLGGTGTNQDKAAGLVDVLEMTPANC